MVRANLVRDAALGSSRSWPARHDRPAGALRRFLTVGVARRLRHAARRSCPRREPRARRPRTAAVAARRRRPVRGPPLGGPVGAGRAALASTARRRGRGLLIASTRSSAPTVPAARRPPLRRHRRSARYVAPLRADGVVLGRMTGRHDATPRSRCSQRPPRPLSGAVRCSGAVGGLLDAARSPLIRRRRRP